MGKAVIPLLLRASMAREGLVGLESDNEGRCLILDALSSLAHFELWPRGNAKNQNPSDALRTNDDVSGVWIMNDLPMILADDHAGVRATAARLWAYLNPQYVDFLFLVGRRLEA